MKAIFDTRAKSGYNDDFDRYHFPLRYLKEAERAVGDWIIYREPRRGGGREGYVAVARLDRIEPDTAIQGHYYGRMSDYLPFDTIVPLSVGGDFYEQSLAIIGAPSERGRALQGKSIRIISDVEFDAIVRDGFTQTLSPENAIRLGLDTGEASDEIAPWLYSPVLEQRRRIAQYVQNRKIRDAAFRLNVLDAYDNCCAVTGLRIVNGGGKAEAQAAHILAVKDGGPDIVQNGLALSSTIHWLFDRHLISLTDHYGLLVSHNRIPSELKTLFARQLDRIHLPKDERLWPHKTFIRRHREAFHG
jgi:putative restriction endonuclease